MMYIKINQTNIKKITYSNNDIFYRDTVLTGFGIRAQKTKIVYFVEAKVHGKLIRKIIADVHKLSAEQARSEAKKLLGDMAKGINIIEQNRKDKLINITLKIAFTDFMTNRERATRTKQEYERTINKDFQEWLNTPLNAITRDMVIKKFKTKSLTAPAQANCLIKILNAIYTFAIEYYRIDGKSVIFENPCNVFRVFKRNPAKVRENIIEPDNLKKFWNTLTIFASDSYKMSQTKTLCKLCLLTGCREQEICTLKRNNIDLENRFIIIEQTKNKRNHIIPYGQEVENILLELCFHKNVDEYLFSTNTIIGHLKNHSKYIKKLNQLCGIKFSLHDLRRSFTTYGAIYLHIDSKIMNILTNHIIQDVTYKHYVTRGTKEFNELRQYFQNIENFIISHTIDNNTSNIINFYNKIS